MKNLIQHNPPHPGDILQELYLKPMELTISKAAQKLLIIKQQLASIIKGNSAISLVLALKLGVALDTTL